MSETLFAHGLAAIQDLPVPRWLFFWAAALTLILSFVALGLLWREPRPEGRQDGRPRSDSLQRFLLWPGWRVILGAVSVGLLIVVWLAALLGKPGAAENIAPVFIWIIFWLGLVPLVVVFGNLWSVLSPWRRRRRRGGMALGKGGRARASAPRATRLPAARTNAKPPAVLPLARAIRAS